MERFGKVSAVLQIKKAIRIGAFFSCAFLFILLTLMIAPVSYKNDSASATTGVAKQSATTITLSATNNQATVSLDINNPNGVFAKSDAAGTAEFGVVTNNAAGYILSIAAGDDSGNLTNDDYNVPVSIASIEQAVTEGVFNTSANNNKWGYKPNKYVDANDEVVDNTGENAKYLPSPTTTATVLDITDTSNTDSNDYSIELAVRADYSTLAGIYSNTFNLIATGNPTPYVIAYDKNTEDTVANMPLSVSAAASEEYVTISSDVPARSNYQFIGWCTVEPESNEGGADTCEGEDANIILAGGKIGIDRTSENNVATIYALWQADSVWQSTSPDGKYYIQDVTDATCPSVPTVVYDKRDGKPYYIQKIKAGNSELCWMTTNLDLAGGTVLNSTTSNIAEGTTYTLPESNAELFSSSANNAPGVFNSNNTVCGLDPCYSYYNYPAATAGTNPSHDDSIYDICPKGWHLPSSQNFKDLLLDYPTYEMLTESPWNGSSSGFFANGRASFVRGDVASYVSSTKMVYTTNFNALFYSGGQEAYYQGTYPIFYGMTIRCVAKKETPRYIQDINESNCPVEKTLVYDKRDEKPYYVRRIASQEVPVLANCWMVTDLDLAGGTVLNSDTSNIADGTTYTLPGSSLQGFDDNDSASVYNSNNPDCDGEAPCGSYYNYNAAMGDVNPESSSSLNVYDICPKGWHMPDAGSFQNNTFIHYSYATDLTKMSDPPFEATSNGYISNGVFYSHLPDRDEDQTSMYFYNARATATSSPVVQTLSVSSKNYSTSYVDRKDGFAVRCMADEEVVPTKTYIQDISKGTCPTTPTIVYDKRDEERYTIQKLADGNCWLLDNLRLNKSTLLTELTDENTNIESTTTFELPKNIKRNFGSTTEAQVNASSRTKTSSYGAGEGQIGSYYNYCAASAGTICGNEVSSDAEEDICPAGWRMPTGGDNGEYQTLINSYNTFEDAKNALRSPVSGYYYGNSKHHQGSYGSFWSSTYDNNNHFYSLDVRLDSVYPDYNSNRDSGLSVRCVAKEKLYLQDITSETCPSVPTIAYDIRDNEEYYVQRLMDGNCWMLENLRLDAATLKTTLTSENTNMPSDSSFTLPASSTSGFNTYTAAKVYAGRKNDTQSYGLGSGKDGVLYNYCAASAGTICSSSNTNDATYDICPKGWSLPSGGADGDYSYLYSIYNSAALLKNALHITLPGYYYGSSLNNRTSATYLLTSTFGYYYGMMQNLYVGTSTVTLPQSMNRYTYYAGSVRCMKEYTGDIAGNVHYDAGAGYGELADQEDVVFKDTVAATNTFSSYYGTFVKWNTEDDGSGIDVMEGDNLDDVATALGLRFGNTLTLYAIWDFNKTVYIQDVTLDMCPNKPAPVYDTRDSNAYYIQKLADGKCWMLDNLRLGGDTAINLTPDNTNISSNFTLPASSIDIYKSNDGYYSPYINADSKDVTGSYGRGEGKFGVYYNYCAASAGTICTESNESDTGQDICPKGWRLPSGGYNGEYYRLNDYYDDDINNSVEIFRNAFHFVFAGIFVNEYVNNDFATHGSASGQGEMAYAWSGTSYYAYEMYTISADSYDNALISPETSLMRYTGANIRCVMDRSEYSVSYDGNGADAGTMTETYDNLKVGDTISLVAPNYSRAGYGFAGWSTDQDAATLISYSQTKTVYGPNETILVSGAFVTNADSNNNIKLYAVWLPQDTTYTMQTFGATQCNNMSINEVIALKDIRDNNVYTVARLDDDHCWMTENLRINPATANITADNTNGPTQDFLDALDTASDSTILCNTNDSACDDTIQYNLNNLNRSLTASPTENNNSSSWYSYGGMYNWYTATAGNGLYSRSSGSVSNDICPTGWRLPTGGSSGNYRALNNAINGGSTTDSTYLVSYPANFIFSGDYNHDTGGGRGTYARLWSATAASNANGYRMGIAPTEVTPLKNWGKWDGFAIRCIVK